MATLCKTFPTTESALQAARALRAAGVPTAEIGVMTGRGQESAGDADEIRIVTRQGDDEHLETADDASARRLLTGAHLPDDIARRMVRHLHHGEAIIFVQLAHVDLGTARALIDQETAAA